MITIWAPHKPNIPHLFQVMDDMTRLGSPTIHVVKFESRYLAIEGSHRLCSAFILDVPVNVVEVGLDFCLLPNRPAHVVLERWGWGARNACYLVKRKEP